MQRELGKEYAQGKEREDFLAANADGVEKKTYMRHFTAEEVLKQKDELGNLSVEIDNIEEELAEVRKEFKDRLKPLYEKRKEVLKNIRNKAEQVTEECYKIVDAEAREVGFFNKLGDLVEGRPAYREELQLDMFKVTTPAAATGTEG